MDDHSFIESAFIESASPRPMPGFTASPRVLEAAMEFLGHVVFYAAVISGHIFGTALLLLGSWFLEWFIDLLHHEKMMFPGASFAFPLVWLFDLSDAVLLFGFLMLASVSILLRLRQTHWAN